MNMYKQITLTLLFLWALMSLKAQEASNEYFEGEVHFRVTTKALDKRIPQEILDRETGTEMIGKVNRDKYLMYQNTGGKLGAVKTILLLEEGIGYVEYANSDTINQFSIEVPPGELLKAQVNEEDHKVILGDTCRSMTFKYTPTNSYGVIEYVEATYYFNPRFKLDKEKYAKHKMSFWNKFVEMGNGGVSVRNEIINYPIYSTTYEATKIIEKAIPEEEFLPNHSKFIKVENK